MPILPDPRDGQDLKIMGRLVAFSAYPVTRTTRRFGIQSRVFATNPWSIIRAAVHRRCPAAGKDQALAFLDQAEDYFNAAKNAGLLAAKPVLIYYSLLNLAKTYVLTVNGRTLYERAYHGLSDRLPPGGTELDDSFLEAVPNGVNVNVFDDFLAAVTGSGLPGNTQFHIKYLLPQILQGHRLWAMGANEKERFISVDRISIRQDPHAKQIWLQLESSEDDLSRLSVTHASLLSDGRLNGVYYEVKGKDINGKRTLCFEQNTPISYTHRPSDKLQELIDTIKPYIWSNVLSVPPYRKHYVYMAPAAEHARVLPQVLSVYALFYYFSSVTRYKPERFAKLLNGRFGAQIEEFMTNLPNQFVYLMASSFQKQEVTKAAIV